jgi:hypothetical protein
MGASRVAQEATWEVAASWAELCSMRETLFIIWTMHKQKRIYFWVPLAKSGWRHTADFASEALVEKGLYIDVLSVEHIIHMLHQYLLVAHLKICSTDNFTTNGAYWVECATKTHMGPTRRVIDKISCLIRGAMDILPVSGAYWKICDIDNMWAPPGPHRPDLCQGYVWCIYNMRHW